MLPCGDAGNTSFYGDASAVEFEMQGRVFKQHVKGRKGENQVGGKRSEVTEFTNASRKRLMEKLNRLDEKALCNAKEQPKFITLTYGQVFPNPQDSKMNLKAFLERLRRRWPNATGFWRLEFQKRGAPHFHLILFGLPFLPFMDLRRWWEEIISWDPSRENANNVLVNIKRIQSWRQLASYVSKYLAKVGDSPAIGGNARHVRPADPEGAHGQDEAVAGPEAPPLPSFLDTPAYLHVGRWWGVFNKACLPLAELVIELFLFGPWVWKVKEAALKIFAYLSRFSPGFTLFLDGDEMKYFWACALDVAEGGAK